MSHDKATFTHPAFVLAAKIPVADGLKHVKGVGADELGVIVPIPVEQIIAIWRGEVYSYDPGSQTVYPDYDGERLGGSVAPSSQIDWVRIK